MKLLFLAVLLICCALAHTVVQDKRGRKHWPSGHHSTDDGGPHHCDCGDCNDPCEDCERPKVTTIAYSPLVRQNVTKHTILSCSPGSYFDAIEYIGVDDTNQTCNGVVSGFSGPEKAVYTGYRYKKDGSVTKVVLNSKWYKRVSTFNNGNQMRVEEIELDDCECDGDNLKTLASWSADDPLAGCCNKGVNHRQATFYQMKIYGKCCSTCSLVQSSFTWDKVLEN